LRSFQQRLPELQAHGIRIVAITVDTPEINRRHRQKMGFTYTFLSDPNAEVTRRYDLLHRRAGPKGTDIPRPAEFLIDSTGIIRWRNLTENIGVRARPEQVLQAFDRMQSTTAH
jgi:peroxiredoxin